MQSHWTDLCKCIRLIQFGPRYTLQLNFVVYFCRAKQVQHFWCCEISGANFPLATSFGRENNPRCSDVFVQDGSFVNQSNNYQTGEWMDFIFPMSSAQFSVSPHQWKQGLYSSALYFIRSEDSQCQTTTRVSFSYTTEIFYREIHLIVPRLLT